MIRRGAEDGLPIRWRFTEGKEGAIESEPGFEHHRGPPVTAPAGRAESRFGHGPGAPLAPLAGKAGPVERSPCRLRLNRYISRVPRTMPNP